VKPLLRHNTFKSIEGSRKDAKPRKERKERKGDSASRYGLPEQIPHILRKRPIEKVLAAKLHRSFCRQEELAESY
jgi:hypothetical protein